MIGINTYNPNAIARYIGEAGLGSHQIVFNPPHAENCSVIVQVGGPAVRSNHCYVQQNGDQTIIQCLDPKTVMKEPINKVFILCALDKARRIHDGESVGPKVDIRIAETAGDIIDFFANYKAPLSIDIETDPTTCEITCIGFAYDNGSSLGIRSLCVPFLHETINYWLEPFEEAEVWSLLAQYIGNDDPKIFQNFIFDTMILSKWGVKTGGKIYDTMAAAHLIEPELPKGLKDLGRLYLNCPIWKDIGSYISNKELWHYNAKDTAYTLEIYKKTLAILEKRGNATFFTGHLAELAPEILRMCEEGWTVDKGAIRRMKDVLQPEIDDLLRSLAARTDGLLHDKVSYVYRRGKPKAGVRYFIGEGRPISHKAGTDRSGNIITKAVAYQSYRSIDISPDLKWLRDHPYHIFEEVRESRTFNPASPLHVKDVISAMGYSIPTKNGRPTTDDLALKKLAAKTKEPFFDEILSYRAKAKMMSTYCNVRLDDDEKLRFSINICGTVGGRFSSKQTAWGTGFNAQNIPKRFRHISIPSSPDYVIVNMDFAQADPHLVAWLAGEDQMLSVLEDPEGDLHSHTAEQIYGYAVDKDSKERKVGKACNNGLNYGMRINRFIETCRKQGLVLNYQEAQHAYKKYFETYPGIREWQKSVQSQIHKTRTLKTPFGRMRYFYQNLSPKVINDALAYIPPTTVADALNVGWLNFLSLSCDLRARVLQQCHDSLKLECHKDDLDATCDALRRAYAAVVFTINGRECNLPIDIEYGPTWGDLMPWIKPVSIK